jgi:hypothetical protein
VMVLVFNFILSRVKRRPLPKGQLATWGIPLIVSGFLTLVQGGYITGGFMSLLSHITGFSYPIVATDFQGFSLRWPLAVPSGHFGPLSLFDPGQVVIMLAEAGLAIVLLPLAIIYWLGKLKHNDRFPQALAAGAVVSFLFPVFFKYGLDFDITRLVGAALWLGFVLAFPIVWLWLVNARQGFRVLAGIGYGVAIYSGLVMLAVELIAIQLPQTTYYLQYRESNFSKPYWNKLEKGAQILDSKPERSVLLFGRASFAAEDVYARSPRWVALVANPDPAIVASEGYSYVYMDNGWWQKLSPELRAAYSQPCVKLVSEMDIGGGQNRRLYNIQSCKP